MSNNTAQIFGFSLLVGLVLYIYPGLGPLFIKMASAFLNELTGMSVKILSMLEQFK
jgi:hypothetical protein